MVLSYQFFNADDCCCPPNTGCCCSGISAGSFNLQYLIESDCAAFDGNSGCLTRQGTAQGCTKFATKGGEFVDNGDCAPNNLNMQATLECWSLTPRTGEEDTGETVIPSDAPEFGYRLRIVVSNSDCTGVPNEVLGDVDSGLYKPVKDLFTYPQCDPFEVIFDVPAPYNRPANGLPAGTACGCCNEGDNIRFIITSGNCS